MHPDSRGQRLGRRFLDALDATHPAALRAPGLWLAKGQPAEGFGRRGCG